MFHSRIKNNIFLPIVISILMIIFSSNLYAASLWHNQSNESNYCSELKGLNVGDIVNVIIVEKATASQKSVVKTKKSTNINGSQGTGPLSAIKSLGLSTKSDFQGDGQTSQTTSLSTRVTARIMKVMPNGNMLIEGKKISQINNEIQKIYVKGIIRPVDIMGDNSVYSTVMGDAEIKMTGKGNNARTTRPGILHRIYNFIF